MYTLGVVILFSMMIFAFYKYLFLLDPLPLFTISLLLKIVNQVRHPPTFSAEFTKSSVFFILKASLTLFVEHFEAASASSLVHEPSKWLYALES